jgi:hypothetical protein
MRLKEGKKAREREHLQNLTGEAPVARRVVALLALLVAGVLAGAASYEGEGHQ